MSFKHLKVGDKVVRMLAGTLPMELVIIKVKGNLLYCDSEPSIITDGHYWTFDRESGAEVDDDLGWGPKYGITGSYLRADTIYGGESECLKIN